MPLLVCSAQSCIYNKSEYCSKGNIKVAGQEAIEPRQTCCSSFQEKTGDFAQNSAGGASEKINVDCEACKCTYNEEHKCQAAQIGIAGSSACQCEQTECSSFVKK